MRKSRRSPPPPSPDLDPVFDLVSPRIRRAVLEASEFMRRHGIRHALVGGLAVGAWGHVRATKDVDFIVGPEGFAEHGVIVTLRIPYEVDGVPIDAVPLPSGMDLDAVLNWSLSGTSHDVPIVPLSVLIAMKLCAYRPQDRADIKAVLAEADSEYIAELRKAIRAVDPSLLPRLARIMDDDN